MITVWPVDVIGGVETTVYTVERRDQYGNLVIAGTQTVNLTSTSTGANKQFRATPGGAGVTSVTIGDGSSTANFYYNDDELGTWTIAVAYSGLTGDSKSLDILGVPATNLVITSFPTTLTSGQVTTAYTVERRDVSGIPVTTGTLTVNLASTSTGANKQFRATSGGVPITSVTIGVGSSTAVFYYYDEKAGSWTISVDSGGLTGDTKTLSVNPAATTILVISGGRSATTAGVLSFAYDVERYDAYGNLVTAGDQVVYTVGVGNAGPGDSAAAPTYRDARQGNGTTAGPGRRAFRPACNEWPRR